MFKVYRVSKAKKVIRVIMVKGDFGVNAVLMEPGVRKEIVAR